MITKEEVQNFLNQFHEKMKIFGIIYLLGGVGCQTICISFHIAEHPLSYPFKIEEE